MSKKLERMNQLISIIKEKNGASVKELAQMFNVSEMTIRRDLHILNSNHVVNNVYGATIYNPSNTLDNLDKNYTLLAAKVKRDSEKSRIGKYAVSLIENNDIIIIDSGSTTEKLATNIPSSIKATVLCFNFNILNSLSDKENINLIFAGGYFHPNTQMFESPEGISLIRNIRATKVFVSAAGIHEKLGITCANNYEAPTKNAILHSAAEKILLADSSKFGQVKSSYFADLCDFQKIISDINLPTSWIDHIKKLGIDLVMV
ncbi:DeoR family transcriptional regulator [Mobilisporobacter senegalensis]|uniref:DeoR family transcriptional regulator n=1 Tax=Mobilisporobacter senegalensis TaxID=1329262 RepID=A0A3N1Y040_9FIRM|nr:DeoR/GlpR family DNA-binding transcription regulator [Mobilisporobacter senegalensis]ROR31881.1 DeoR family transcriptional regulator [Mobilisporobacter senegalensis]